MQKPFRRLVPGVIAMCLFAAGTWADNPQVRAQAAKLNNLGVAMMNQQLMEKATAKFDEAYKADPTLAVAILNKGIALLNQQRLPEAEEAIQKAAALDPGNPRVWYNLGLVHRGSGNTAEAISDFQKVLKIDPTDPDAYYFLGTFYSQQQEYSKAIESFQQALKINPLHASAEFGLGRALQRSGQTDEARVHLKRFEYLTHNKISSAITLTYGEQGKYSVAQDVITTEPNVGTMIPVTFKPLPIGKTAKIISTEAGGGGMCMIDTNGNGTYDLVTVSNTPPQPIRMYRNAGGKWTELPPQETGLLAKGEGVACAVGDYDNDGKADIAVSLSDRVLLYHNTGGGKFVDVTASVGIQPTGSAPGALTFVDYDHDSDLDLFVTGGPRSVRDAKESSPTNVLWRNNGNGTFTNWTAESGLGGSGRGSGAATLSDINNDRAVDLVVAQSDGVVVYLNQREGKFKPLPVYDVSEKLPPPVGVYVFDFNKDGWMDVAVTHQGSPGITLWRNVEGQRFERVPLPVKNGLDGKGLTAIDFDNDGWLDVAVLLRTEPTAAPQLHIFRNLGSQGFEDVTAKLGLDKVKLVSPVSVIAADVYDHHVADLIVSQLDSDPVVLRNEGGDKNHALKIMLKGLADNKTALGTKVEVFANGTWQKFEVAGGAGYLSQGPPEILAGLGKNETADIVRMLWPTGVLQDEIDVAANKPASFLELDRRGSSCPTLFAWNGEKYEFITDVIGAGVIGHWISPTSRNTPDPDEWVKIDGSKLRAKDGYLSVRFGEPMEEVNYVDQLRMVAVDHPADMDVYPDERFLDEPPFASGKTVATSKPHAPAGAWDNQGRDVLQLLSATDHQYVRDFTNLPYAGFANTHSLTLDLGTWTPQQPLRLFLSGFIEYFSATSMYAAWQAGLKPTSPYIEAQMPDGSWQRIVEEMGFPAGLPRTITVDLTGKLHNGTQRIRITSNLQIYWDEALVDNGPTRENEVRTTELPLASATLGFRGYPRQVDGDTPGDLTYRYEEVSATGPFSRFRGSYTQYGDVTPLLTSIDNHFAIFGTGEDIDAEFDTAALPALPQGWKRDYFFYANGFVKDMDFYEAIPFTVAEMPFHGMSMYPYPAAQHYPDDAQANGYRFDWNDRFESGANKAPGYRFVYNTRTIDPQPLTPHKKPHDDEHTGGSAGQE
jgi:tetratricopeptide (TPR) repeat protein